jgi:hypothetical protein
VILPGLFGRKILTAVEIFLRLQKFSCGGRKILTAAKKFLHTRQDKTTIVVGVICFCFT